MSVSPIENTPYVFATPIIDLDAANLTRLQVPSWPVVNDPVPLWKNLVSPSGLYDYEQSDVAAQPIFYVDSKSRAAVRFTNDFHLLGTSIISLGVSDPWTLFVAYRTQNASLGTIFSNGISGTNGFGYRVASNNRIVDFYNSAVKTDGTATTSNEIAAISYDGSASSLIVNLSSESLTNSGANIIATSGGSQAILGAVWDGANIQDPWEGLIYRVLFYSGTLTAYQIDQISQFLNHQYR